MRWTVRLSLASALTQWQSISVILVRENYSYQGSIMHMSFMEIAFEAELNTEEHPELMELALELRNEHPETRAAAIQEFREMIYERGECSPRRMDDLFLMRFMRARRYNKHRAHSLLVRYCAFLEQYPELYRGVDLWGLEKVKNVFEGTMMDAPHLGRISVFKFGVWDPDEYPVIDLVRAGLATMEIGLRCHKLQVLGGTAILDLENVGLKQISTVSPTVAYQIVSLLGKAIPCYVNSVHFINYNFLLNTCFYLFKRFIDKKTYKRIFFHGSDTKSLHKHVEPEYLPPSLGGTCKQWSNAGLWFQKIRQYRDEGFDREMKEFGYYMKDDVIS